MYTYQYDQIHFTGFLDNLDNTRDLATCIILLHLSKKLVQLTGLTGWISKWVHRAQQSAMVEQYFDISSASAVDMTGQIEWLWVHVSQKSFIQISAELRPELCRYLVDCCWSLLTRYYEIQVLLMSSYPGHTAWRNICGRGLALYPGSPLRARNYWWPLYP